jgi:hypothetical protein
MFIKWDGISSSVAVLYISLDTSEGKDLRNEFPRIVKSLGIILYSNCSLFSDMTVDTLKVYIRKFLSKLFIESLVYGNVTREVRLPIPEHVASFKVKKNKILNGLMPLLNISAKKSSRSDWGSNLRPTAIPPSTKYSTGQN